MIRDHKKAQEVYIESIMPPIQQVDEMFCHLGLDLWSVEVIKCPGNDLENAQITLLMEIQIHLESFY